MKCGVGLQKKVVLLSRAVTPYDELLSVTNGHGVAQGRQEGTGAFVESHVGQSHSGQSYLGQFYFGQSFVAPSRPITLGPIPHGRVQKGGAPKGVSLPSWN